MVVQQNEFEYESKFYKVRILGKNEFNIPNLSLFGSRIWLLICTNIGDLE